MTEIFRLTKKFVCATLMTISLLFIGVFSFGDNIPSWNFFWTNYKNASYNGVFSLDIDITVENNIGDFAFDAPLIMNGLGHKFIGNDYNGFSFDNKTLNFTDIAINNFYSPNGGAISVTSSTLILFGGANKGVTFIGNSINESNGQGGAIFGSYSQMGISNTNFLNNSAFSNGGAIAVEKNSYITFSGNQPINFIGNESDFANGGAIFVKNSTLAFATNVNNAYFLSNRAQNGGAIYAYESNMSIKDAIFSGNSAYYNGGAIYIEKSTLTINAMSKDIVFTSNTTIEEHIPNDIYMKESRLTLNAIANIKINGGIKSDGNRNIINKIGAGQLIINGELNFNGAMNIQAGTFIRSYEPHYAYISTLTVSAGALYSVQEQSFITTNVDKLIMIGELDIGLDFDYSTQWTADFILATDTIEIVEGSTLTVAMYGNNYTLSRQRPVPVMQAQNELKGEFWNTVGKQGRLEYKLITEDNTLYLKIVTGFPVPTLNVEKLTHNQEQVQNMLNSLDKEDLRADAFRLPIYVVNAAGDQIGARRLLDQLHGEFLANAIMMGALNNNEENLYKRLNPTGEEESKPKSTIWIEGDLYGLRLQEENTGDFWSNTSRVQAGADLLITKTIAIGIFAGYSEGKLKQDKSRADMKDTEIGLYGGWFGGETIDVKGFISLGEQSYQTSRQIAFPKAYEESVFEVPVVENPIADFITKSVRFGVDVEYELEKTNKNISLKPFVGLQGGVVRNKEIKEELGHMTNLTIDANTYLRLSGLVGAKAVRKRTKFTHSGKVYAGYILAGNRAEYDMSMEGIEEYGKMNIWSAQDDVRVFVGIGLGTEYKVSEHSAIFINGDISSSLETFKYFASAGINNRFGKKVHKFVEDPNVLIVNKLFVHKGEIDLNNRCIVVLDYVLSLNYKFDTLADKGLEMIQSFGLPITSFQTGKAELSEDLKFMIKNIAQTIQKYDYTRIRIEGFADSTGSEAKNKVLSQERAKAVYDEFILNGIEEYKLEYTGLGSSLPVESNNTTNGRAVNRRTEIFVE